MHFSLKNYVQLLSKSFILGKKRHMQVWIKVFIVSLVLMPLISHAQTPTLVKDICPGNCSSHRDDNQYQNYPIMAEINGQYVFYAVDREWPFNNEIYITDGSESGTYLLKDISPGPQSSLSLTNVFKILMPFNNAIYFIADDSISGKEMWRTDGTTSGTNLLVDFNVGTGTGASPNYDHNVINNTLIYRCNGGSGNRLCFLAPGSSSPDSTALGIGASSDLIFAEDKVFFAKGNSSSSATLWVSDGTVAGTISTGVTSNIRDMLFYYDGYVYYTVLDSVYSVYRSNGTVPGTNLVLTGKRPPYLSETESSYQRFHISWNNKILMNVMHSLQNYELYISDGTEQGTYLLKEINTDSLFASPQNQPKMSSSPAWFCEYRNKVYFAAQSTEFDRELWMTDGTEAGTVRLLDIYAGPNGSGPAEVQTIGSGLMFVATDSAHGRELWVSDGTAAGTRCLDLRPGPESSDVRNIYNTGTELYFFALLDTALGTELYKMPLPVVDTTVIGITDIDRAATIQIWPNPATSSISIRAAQTGGLAMASVALFDIQGKQLTTQTLATNSFETQIDVSALGSGIYFIEVTDVSGQISKHKVVVTR